MTGYDFSITGAIQGKPDSEYYIELPKEQFSDIIKLIPDITKNKIP
ncbi:MAG UNVERIFIED_CONTAM: hypothetical protein LVQ98_05805 [Rickettsiaceae bacterium]